MIKLHEVAPSALLALAIGTIATSASAQEGSSVAASQAASQESDDVIIVRGALVPDEKRATAEISSLVDAEDFARQGDSDIAAALRRVTGISIVDGKFPISRGLNERYSSATLNGVPLPSPEPLRRAAPLDLIPTSILSGSLAQKTFSPQFSGEFGGAAIDMTTITVPEENFLTLSAGFGLDTESTYHDGLFYEGGEWDELGFDDGLRDLPDVANQAARNGIGSVGQRALDLSFEQDDTLLIADGDVPGDASFSGTAGYLFVDNADLRFGTTTYVGYSNDWQLREGEQDRFLFLGRQREFNFEETRQEIGLNAMNVTGVEFGDHEISLTSFVLRNTLKRARITRAFETDLSSQYGLLENTDWVEREVWQTQLAGSHLFPDAGDLEADWRIAYGEASREAPYSRQTRRSARSPEGPFSYDRSRAQFNTLEFSDLQDENIYAAIDFTLPVDLMNRTSELKFGGAYTDKSRENLRTDFDFRNPATQQPIPSDLALARIDMIYSTPVLESNLVDMSVRSSRLFPDASDASLEVMAGYVMADFEINDYLRASFGARYEEATQESAVELTSATDGRQEFDALEDDHVLPAATITWNPFGNVQVRGGYSQTITRPQFRELAATEFLDPDLDVLLEGNPFLVNSEIDNFDIRAEWYFSRGEFMTVGAFYKDIENPIEQYFTGAEDGSTSFLNAPGAEVWGVEAEFEKAFALDEMFDDEMWYGKELFFGTNYTYTQSEVSADGDVITSRNNQGTFVPTVNNGEGFIVEGRSLQGQSDHLFNIQLGIQEPSSGMSVTALINYASERVLFAEGPDENSIAVLEQPPVSLDLVVKQDIEIMGATYGLGIEVQNILRDDFETYRIDDNGVERPFLQYDRGVKFGASLSRTF